MVVDIPFAQVVQEGCSTEIDRVLRIQRLCLSNGDVGPC